MYGRTRCTLIAAALALAAGIAQAGGLATEAVVPGSAGSLVASDGIVEAVRSSTLGADVSGKVTERVVEPGSNVRAGQTLLRIDARVAEQQAAVARAQLAVARADYNRQAQLYDNKFISKAAFDRAEADYRSAQAQAAAAGVQSGLHVLAAPYAGRISAVSVQLGDMVMPGQALITLYDPSAMRVTAHLPQRQTALIADGPATIEVPAADGSVMRLESRDIQVLPAADPLSQSVEVRIGLAVKPGQLTPGAFARLSLPMKATADPQRVTVATRAVVRRSELTAVYVVREGRPQLRQVRLGRTLGDRVEVLAGLEGGEQVALDPLAATRQR